MNMHRLAFHPFTRAGLWLLVDLLRPFRFALGISHRSPRPLSTLLAL